MSAQACNYSIESNSSNDQLVIDCRNCIYHGKIKRESCLDRMIGSMEGENDIDTILMKGHYLTLFRGKAVLIIKKIAELRISINQMSERRTGGERPGGTRAGSNKEPFEGYCQSCSFKPGPFFSDLHDELRSDLAAFNEALKNTINELNGHLVRLDQLSTSDHCVKCMGELLKDLTFLFVRYRDLARDVTETGFSVVVRR